MASQSGFYFRRYLKAVVALLLSSEFTTTFLHNFFMAKNWCRQIQIMRLLDHFDKKWHFLMIKNLMFNFLYMLTLCSCLLNYMRIFALKIFFLTSSKYFTETNFRKHFFKLATKLIYINMKYLDDLRHNRFSKKISWAFYDIMAPKDGTLPKSRD